MIGFVGNRDRLPRNSDRLRSESAIGFTRYARSTSLGICSQLVGGGCRGERLTIPIVGGDFREGARQLLTRLAARALRALAPVMNCRDADANPLGNLIERAGEPAVFLDCEIDRVGFVDRAACNTGSEESENSLLPAGGYFRVRVASVASSWLIASVCCFCCSVMP